MARECIKHQMPDGTIMNGPVHGDGQVCLEWKDTHRKGGKIKNPRYKGKRRTAVQYSAGGKLVGPSHEEGGIPVIVDGTEPIEVEGGEFIINKQTVDAVGEDFLHKLNSTQTTHHTGGFSEGQLPGPSKFKDGGKVTRRNNMARGRRRAPRNRGKAPMRKMSRGGNAVSTGGMKSRRMAAGGRMCGGMGQPPCAGGYRRGGRTKPRPVKKYAHGGMHGGSHVPKNQCRMLTSAHDCNHTAGCHWNPSGPNCE